MKKKNVLMIVSNLDENGGVTKVVMNNYDLLQKEYNVDFCVINDTECTNKEYVLKQGSNYYIYPQNKKEIIKFLNKILGNGCYDIIHVHITGFFAVSALMVAKKYNISKRIYHIHNPKEIYNLKSWLRCLVYENLCIFLANKYFACSEYAGKSVLGKRKFSIIRNTINTKKFRFDKKFRDKCRNLYNISNDEIVIGVVARMVPQKNPMFIIKIFNEILKINSKVRLLWIGEGYLKSDIIKKIEELRIEKNVVLLGVKENVFEWYSAFDIFLLPSLYEGLGIVFLEAQASGIPIFTSNNVPKDTKISNLINYLNIELSANIWAKMILDECNKMEYNRNDSYLKVLNSDFEISKNNDLIEAYKKI